MSMESGPSGWRSIFMLGGGSYHAETASGKHADIDHELTIEFCQKITQHTEAYTDDGRSRPES
ncbi:MAG: hypothetical protein ACK4ZN_08740 [Oceanibaculum sp.]